MNKHIRFIIIILIAIFFPRMAWATHIVGGEITYRCLGNSQYEILVTVFRDCDTGVPPFDNPASLGIFGSNNQLLQARSLDFTRTDTLDLFLTDTCYVAPPNVCIERTTYRDTISLPFRVGGYQLVYQRCCRNTDIVNIIAPLNTGATYMNYISEQALLACDASPVFRDWPPVYLCKDVPIVFDHSATDLNGDSLVYDLYAPFDGASPQNPMPQPPFNPPYDSVRWAAGGYSTQNMLGGTDRFRIDPVTGMLAGTPSRIGVFVVGVRVRAYRNGVLIGTVQRDFQYAVGICGRRENAAFFAPSVFCDNSLSLQFLNQSNSNPPNYVWDFGDTSTNLDVSTLENPIYTYPDTGAYTVRLVVAPGTTCSDTFYRTISVQYESLFANFQLATTSCTNRATVQGTNTSTDTISQITSWFWDFGDPNPANVDTFRTPNATYVYTQSGTYNVRLIVQSRNGCRDTINQTLTYLLPYTGMPDTSWICPTDSSRVLNGGGNPQFQHFWQPPTYLSSITATSPVVTPPIGSTNTYVVTVTANNPNNLVCRFVDSTVVAFPPPFTVDITADTVTCQGSVNLLAQSNTNISTSWSFHPIFDTLFSTTNPTPVPLTGANTTVYLQATDRAGCVLYDTIRINAGNFPIQARYNALLGACGAPRLLSLSDITADTSRGAIVTRNWTITPPAPSSPILLSGANPSIQLTESGVYTIDLEVISDRGCIGRVNGTIVVLVPAITNTDSVGICPGQSTITLNQGGNPNFQYQWSPSTNLSSTTAVSPITNTSVTRVYRVTITGIIGTDTCRAVDSVRVVRPTPLTISTPNRSFFCGTTVSIPATPNRPVDIYQWSGDNTFNTVLSTQNPFVVAPQVFPVSGYYVRGTDRYGCTATSFAIVEQINRNVTVQFGYNIVRCVDTLLVQFTDLTVDTLGSRIVDWRWQVSTGDTSRLRNPQFVFRSTQTYTVTLTVRLANGCVGTLTRNIDFRLVALNSRDSVALCAGQNSRILNPNGDATATYSWSPATGLSGTNLVSPIATPPSLPFTYTVTVTNSNGADACLSVKQITLFNPPVLNVNLPPDTTLCGNSLIVQAGIQNIQNLSRLDWGINNRFVPILISNVNPVFLNLGAGASVDTIFARVVDVYGCATIDSMIITHIVAPITVSFTRQIQQCQPNVVVQFQSNQNSNVPIYQYFWTFGDGRTSNATNPSHTYTQSGVYPISLFVQDVRGCTGIFRDTLRINIPEIQNLDTLALCQGGTTVLNQGGNPNLQYQWSPAIGLSNPTAVSPSVTVTNNITYTVTVTANNSFGVCTLVDRVAIGATPVQLEAMNDTSICGTRVTLQANSPTATQYVWAWDRNFAQIVGFGANFQTNINSSRRFYVRAQDAYGCFAMDSVLVQSSRNPFTANFSASLASCTDSSGVQFTDLTDTIQQDVASRLWEFGDTRTSNLLNPLHYYQQAGNYNVTLTAFSAIGCVASVTQPLQLTPIVLANWQDTINVCAGDTARLNPNGNTAYLYTWTPTSGLNASNIPNPLLVANTTQTYIAQIQGTNALNGVADTCGLSQTVRVRISPAPVASFGMNLLGCVDSVGVRFVDNSDTTNQQIQTRIWQFGNVQTSSLPSLTRYYPQAGNYSVTLTLVSNIGCSTTVQQPLILRPIAVQNWQDTVRGCFGDTARLNPNGNTSYQYAWTPISGLNLANISNPLTTITANQTYSANISAIQTLNGQADTCAVSRLVRVLGDTPPVLTIAGDTSLCSDTVRLTAQTTGTGVEWSNSPNFNPILSNNLALVSNLVGGSGTFYARSSTVRGCIVQKVQTVRTHSLGLSIERDLLQCAAPPRFTVQTFGDTAGLSTQWGGYLGDTLVLSWINPNTVEVIATPNSILQVRVSNIYGCTAMDTATVGAVLGAPIADIRASRDSVGEGDTLQLVTPNNISYFYDWQPRPTLNSGIIYNPIASPLQNTTYFLTVTDANGCVSTDSFRVYLRASLCGEPNIFVPNAFTPDGDGLNDILYVRGANLTKVHLVIYDRWGEAVFETKNQSVGWNGTINGQQLPPDVYGFYLICECAGGQQFYKQGNITLFR